MNLSSNPDTNPLLNPTAIKYGLKLIVRKVRRNAYQGIKGLLWKSLTEYTAIALEIIPNEKQNNEFMFAWLPDFPPKYDETGNIIYNHPPEVIISLQDRPFGMVRCYVMRADREFSKNPYLLVASLGAEEDISRIYKSGKKINAISESSVDDVLGDQTIMSETTHAIYR